MADQVDVAVSIEETSVEINLEQINVEVQLAGPTGPAATGAVDAHFELPFISASTVSVPHNLGKYPAVTVIDSAGDEVIGDVQHLSANSLQLIFSAPFSGTVFCN